MKSVWLSLGLMILLAAGACGGDTVSAGLEIPAGSEISVVKKDGVTVQGRLVEVRPEAVVVERNGERTFIGKQEIARISYAERAEGDRAAFGEERSPAPADPAARPADLPARPAARVRAAEPKAPAGARVVPDPPAADRPAALPTWRDVTVPAGTSMRVELRTAVGSQTSELEDQVRGTLASSVVVDGVEAVPAGAVLVGHVTEATRSGRVKGRARVAFRFSRLDLPGETERIAIRTAPVAREAAATKKEDAAKIGGAAAAGAIIGGIVGGGDGAAKGAAIGGGAGTAAVLSTRGDEVTLPAGTMLSVQLTQPVTVRILQR